MRCGRRATRARSASWRWRTCDRRYGGPSQQDRLVAKCAPLRWRPGGTEYVGSERIRASSSRSSRIGRPLPGRYPWCGSSPNPLRLPLQPVIVLLYRAACDVGDKDARLEGAAQAAVPSRCRGMRWRCARYAGCSRDSGHAARGGELRCIPDRIRPVCRKPRRARERSSPHPSGDQHAARQLPRRARPQRDRSPNGRLPVRSGARGRAQEHG